MPEGEHQGDRRVRCAYLKACSLPLFQVEPQLLRGKPAYCIPYQNEYPDPYGEMAARKGA